MELAVSPFETPSRVLTLLFDAINALPGSRYHGRVERNSRCVTVTYDDGVRVDLMPIARLSGQPEKAGNLFHWRPASAEAYHKPVNPWGFADHFNRLIELYPTFVRLFEDRRAMSEGIAVAKAETDPLPEQTPLSEKSPRVVALQLMKRNRDIRYRPRAGRKPPSIMLSAFALEINCCGTGLLDELLSISAHVARRLEQAVIAYNLITVTNPAYRPDIFTDRWPSDVPSQQLYLNDLRHFQRQLLLLKSDRLTATEMKIILDDLFGETAATFALEEHLKGSRRDLETKGMRFGSRGHILTGAAAATAAATSMSARASTYMGGEWHRG